MIKNLSTADPREWLEQLRAGDEIKLSGRVYTARDAAHKKISAILDGGGALPFELKNAFIYYAGPTPAAAGRVCGSFGPTTSSRMDIFTPRLMELGLAGTIGKGGRSAEVIESAARTKSVYLIAIGGAGAYAARHIKSCEETAFPELGCESVKTLVFGDFPLICAIDSRGNYIYDR